MQKTKIHGSMFRETDSTVGELSLNINHNKAK